MRRRIAGLTGLLLVLGAVQAPASYLETFYPERTLTYWQSRYPDNVRWNFDHLLMKHLTAEERRAVGSVELQFPPIASGQHSPINFYATERPRSIVMPVLSIKLFDDIAIASAWLLFNGFSQETLYNYLSMIKYKDPDSLPGKRFPPPLEALQIPADALSDQRVDSLSQKILKSAIVFILAHELGHLRHRHPGYDIPMHQARQNELQADHFAIEMMRRIGVAPMGITQFFMAALYLSSHRGDFSTDAQWEAYLRTRSTHPLSPQRMRELSLQLKAHAADFARTEPDIRKAVARINYVAGQLDIIADILTDRDIQKSIAHIGRTMEPAYLNPRPEGGTGPQLKDRGQDGSRSGQAFSGLYEGAFGSRGGEGVTIAVRFERNNQNVVGEYTYGLGAGKINGIVEKNRLYFQWQEGATHGRGLFEASQDGLRFQGSWGYDQSRDNGGWWTGKRD